MEILERLNICCSVLILFLSLKSPKLFQVPPTQCNSGINHQCMHILPFFFSCDFKSMKLYFSCNARLRLRFLHSFLFLEEWFSWFCDHFPAVVWLEENTFEFIAFEKTKYFEKDIFLENFISFWKAICPWEENIFIVK